MRIGAVYPQIELAGDPVAARTLGFELERLGYDFLVAYDHVLGAVHTDRRPPLTGPYDETHPFHDPFVLFAYLAGRTSTLEFATGVLVLPQRQTALVAKQAADLSILSDGRFRLGVGTGWNPVEYESLGQEFSTRGQRLDEQLSLIRRLWQEPVVEHRGNTDRIDRAGLLPRPTHPIPIWMGGYSDVAFRRAALHGDGFIFGGPFEVVNAHWARTREFLRHAGRELAQFGAEYVVLGRSGTAELVGKLERWQALGGTHLSVSSMRLGLDSLEAHLDYFGRVADVLQLSRRPTT